MTQIKFITVGTLKEDYLKDAVAEYKKRLSQFAKIEEVIIKEERIQNEDNPKEIEDALFSEGEKILKAVPKDSYKVALCVEGIQYTSEALADIIRSAQDRTGKITFIIGSSHGLAKEVKNEANLKLSVSKMTFPHQLMQLILAEGIYRSFTIISGKKYHK